MRSFCSAAVRRPSFHHDKAVWKDLPSLNRKLKNIEHDLPIIFIGMGTCGLASGALKLKKQLKPNFALIFQSCYTADRVSDFEAREVLLYYPTES